MSRFGIRRKLKKMVMGNEPTPTSSKTPTVPPQGSFSSPNGSMGSSSTVISPQKVLSPKKIDIPKPKDAEPPSEKDAKILKHRKRTKVALLKLTQKKGGTASLGDLHDLAEKRFFIAHKAFSDLMEEMVAEDIVHYDWSSQEATITQTGIELLETS
jgi:hypothetical protein